MRKVIVYSSLTGNTKKIATHLSENISAELFDADTAMTQLDLDAYDIFIICYWTDRGIADPKSRKFIDLLHDKKIIAVGTLGGPSDTDYAQSIKDRVRAYAAEKSNFVIGDFICQGKIDPARTEARLKIPKGEPRYLDEEGYKRHLESRTHPDEIDLANAVSAVTSALN